MAVAHIRMMHGRAEKKYRDQALKKLTVYLTKKSEWSALEWDKLWKALFYCMWMSDKRPIQEELSTSLSQLVHKLPTTALALGFVHSFFRTMHREWHGIDGLRYARALGHVLQWRGRSIDWLLVFSQTRQVLLPCAQVRARVHRAAAQQRLGARGR